MQVLEVLAQFFVLYKFQGAGIAQFIVGANNASNVSYASMHVAIAVRLRAAEQQ